MVRYLAVFTALFFVSFFSFAGICDQNPTLCQGQESKNIYGCHMNGVDLGNIEQQDCIDVYDATGCRDGHMHDNGIHVTGNCGVLGSYSIKDTVTGCVDDDYPIFDSESNGCVIRICDDGFFGDPTKQAVCDRPIPTMPPECGNLALNMASKPFPPSCESDFPDPISDPDSDESDCRTFVNDSGEDTTVCSFDENKVCQSTGVCPPGCGNVTTTDEFGATHHDFVCIGDNAEDANPDLELSDDAKEDPFVEGACRMINGTSYCPQDEKDHINADGKYEELCGYIGETFYCTEDKSVNLGHEENEDFDSLPDENATDTEVLTSINKDLQKGFKDISGDLGELEKGLSKNLGGIADSIDDLAGALTGDSGVVKNGSFDISGVQIELDTAKLEYENYFKSIKNQASGLVSSLSVSAGSFSQCKNIISFNGKTEKVCFSEFEDEMRILANGILLIFTILSGFLLLGAYRK